MGMLSTFYAYINQPYESTQKKYLGMYYDMYTYQVNPKKTEITSHINNMSASHYYLAVVVRFFSLWLLMKTRQQKILIGSFHVIDFN